MWQVCTSVAFSKGMGLVCVDRDWHRENNITEGGPCGSAPPPLPAWRLSGSQVGPAQPFDTKSAMSQNNPSRPRRAGGAGARLHEGALQVRRAVCPSCCQLAVCECVGERPLTILPG